MVIEHLVGHGAFFFVVVTGYLLAFMVAFSPRVWGYADYPQAIRDKISPQTKREKLLAGLVGLPWILFVLGFPIVSTMMLETKLGGEISLGLAVLNVLVLIFLANLGDLVLLDWLVVSRITPRFVIIPGTVKADYKDFSHHYKAHAKAAVIQVFVGLVIASAVWYF